MKKKKIGETFTEKETKQTKPKFLDKKEKTTQKKKEKIKVVKKISKSIISKVKSLATKKSK